MLVEHLTCSDHCYCYMYVHVHTINTWNSLSLCVHTHTQMTSWVCTEILTRDSPSSRATVIEHFIQIAHYCFQHNDLHCSLNVTFALSSSIIRGLRKTWDEVDKKVHSYSCKHITSEVYVHCYPYMYIYIYIYYISGCVAQYLPANSDPQLL